jgi:hypothetical protein
LRAVEKQNDQISTMKTPLNDPDPHPHAALLPGQLS